MFSMGMTLKIDDIKLALVKPKALVIGVTSQYTIMPLVAFALATMLDLPAELAAGLVLVGSAPGGTASNVMVYLSKGDVALSVAMTSISTLIAPIMIPALMFIFAGKWVDVDFIALFLSSTQIILLPIAMGLIFKKYFKKAAKKFVPVIPALAIVSIIMIISALIAANAGKFDYSDSLGKIFSAVVLHNLIGFALGYSVAYFAKFDETKRRAVSIEVGMQSSGLSAVLAMAHFGPLATLPSIIFSVWHNIAGASLANFWSFKDSKKTHARGKPDLIYD